VVRDYPSDFGEHGTQKDVYRPCRFAVLKAVLCPSCLSRTGPHRFCCFTREQEVPENGETPGEETLKSPQKHAIMFWLGRAPTKTMERVLLLSRLLRKNPLREVAEGFKAHSPGGGKGDSERELRFFRAQSLGSSH
jgi:hypothetical protein